MSLSERAGRRILVSHIPCIECSSKDALTVWDNGGHCFSCKTDFPLDRFDEDILSMSSTKTVVREKPRLQGVVGPIKDRRINKDTVKFYQMRLKVDDKGTVVEHQYPYISNSGDLVAVKIRGQDKSFYSTGSIADASLFGLHLFNPKEFKTLVITEGELDALAVYQMSRGMVAAVSLKNGAQAALKDLKKDLEGVLQYSKVVLCFDNDKPGREAVAQVKNLFKPGQLKIINMSGFKDACDYLKAGKENDFRSALNNAKDYQPEEIIPISEFKGLLERMKNTKVESVEWPFEGLQTMTGGIRLGELITVTAFTAIGKSALLKEVATHITRQGKNNKVGLMFLEERNDKTVTDLCSINAGMPLHIHKVLEKVPPHELQKYEDAVVGSGQFHVFNHFGSNSIDNIISKMRFMAQGLGVKYIFLDHISILVSDNQASDERKTLDEIATKLKTLAIELDIAIIACVHLNRSGQIRGSAAIEQLSDVVIKLYRDKLADDLMIANTTRVVVVKNRFNGREGTACDVLFDNKSWRMVQSDHMADKEYDIIKRASESAV